MKIIIPMILLMISACAASEYNFANNLAIVPPSNITAEQATEIRSACDMTVEQIEGPPPVWDRAVVDGALSTNGPGYGFLDHTAIRNGDEQSKARRERRRLERLLKPCLESSGFTIVRMTDEQYAAYSELEGSSQHAQALRVANYWNETLGH